ncbi:MAG: helix-turn-helix transcriptional regulator [Candidatus Dormibacteraeota bacterium]|nr:helix-turn-helix transcriptional regulator [Candidatus Dormibacteraeota bacterium]
MGQKLLSPGEWAVLGLLVERPRHGFALVKAMAPGGEIGRVWSLPRPLVYRALSTLEAKGLASATGLERSDVGPLRQVVAPTDDGRDKLFDWLSTPVDHLRDVRSLLMLKLALTSRLDRDPQPLMEAQARHFSLLVQALERRADEAANRFDRLLMLWRLESAQAAMRFFEQAPGVVGAAAPAEEPDGRSAARRPTRRPPAQI